MQKTAADWLQEKLKETYNKEGKLPLAYTLHLVKQAKELEKQQIIDAVNFGIKDPFLNIWVYPVQGEPITKGETYYNETFNKK